MENNKFVMPEIEENIMDRLPPAPYSVPFNVYLTKTIGAETNSIIKELLYWENENVKAVVDKKPVYPIILHINSPGGSLYDCWGIVDTIKGIETPVVTYSYGKAMSAAALILMSGTPGSRLVAPNSWIMLHELSTWLGGSFSDVDNTMRHMKKIQDQVVTHISKCCKQNKKEVATMIKEDRYFSAKEAVKFGIADEISVVPKIVQDIPMKYFTGTAKGAKSLKTKKTKKIKSKAKKTKKQKVAAAKRHKHKY